MRQLIAFFGALLFLIVFQGPVLATDNASLNVGGLVYYYAGEGSVNRRTFAMDTNTDDFGCVYQMPEAATITTACYLNGFKTGTSPTYKIIVSALDASGFGTNTALGGGSPASSDFTAGSDDSFQCETLDNSIALTRGQRVAIHFDYTSGTINGSNYEEFAVGLVSNGSSVKNGMPYCYTCPSGTCGKISTSSPVFALKSASKTYGYPATDIESTAYSSDSSPDEYALAFKLPTSTCTTYKVKAVTCLVRQSATGKTLDVKLYSGTTQQQILDNLDSDVISATPAGSDRVPYRFVFEDSTLVALDCGTSYSIGFVPNETSSNFALAVIDVATAAELGAYPGGTDWFLRTRADAGAWTDVTDKRPLCDLEIDDITVSGGSSNVKVSQGMNGGFQ
jgi:hypothetical protein